MIVAAADGSSLSNPGPSGWAWYVDDEHWHAGGWPHGTNNMGELMAVLDLLQETAGVDDDLTILCDSQYAINCISKWMAGWKRRGWKKADGKPVLNVEILRELDMAMQGRRVRFEWVKGHAGHPLNEAADGHARAAATAFQQGRPVEHGPGFGGSTNPTAVAAPTPGAAVAEPDLFSAEPESDEEQCWAAEESLLSDVVRGSWRLAATLLHPEFFEWGAAGRPLTLGNLRGTLGPLRPPVSLERVQAARLGPDAILLVWRARTAGTSEDSERVTLRSSVWQRHQGEWKLRFHQGTPAAVD